MPRFRQSSFVECFFFTEKLGNRECRIFAERQIKPRNIDAGEVHAVIDPVVIGIVSEKCVVPRFKLAAEHQVQFQMEMRALLVYSNSGVAHGGDGLAAFDRIAGAHSDGTQVSIETVVIRAVPAMLDHNIFTIV